MARSYIPPKYNEAIMCPNCGESSDILTEMHGIIGGGSGKYTCCALCGLVVTKDFDDDPGDILDAEFTEVPKEIPDVETDKK